MLHQRLGVDARGASDLGSEVPWAKSGGPGPTARGGPRDAGEMGTGGSGAIRSAHRQLKEFLS